MSSETLPASRSWDMRRSRVRSPPRALFKFFTFPSDNPITQAPTQPVNSSGGVPARASSSLPSAAASGARIRKSTRSRISERVPEPSVRNTAKNWRLVAMAGNETLDAFMPKVAIRTVLDDGRTYYSVEKAQKAVSGAKFYILNLTSSACTRRRMSTAAHLANPLLRSPARPRRSPSGPLVGRRRTREPARALPERSAFRVAPNTRTDGIGVRDGIQIRVV